MTDKCVKFINRTGREFNSKNPDLNKYNKIQIN